MDFLVELLKIKEENNGLFDDQLLEELGNLNAINKSLLKVFKTTPSWNSKGSPKLLGGLGQNSGIEELKLPNQNAVFDQLGKEGCVGVILKYDGVQVLAVILASTQAYVSGRSTNVADYRFIADEEFFKKVIDNESFEKELDVTGSTRGEKYSRSAGRIVTKYIDAKNQEFKVDKALSGTSTTAAAKIKKVIKTVFESAKKNKVEVVTMAIKLDKERSKTSSERAKSREGTVPLPTGNRVSVGGGKYSNYETEAKNYVNSLRDDLRSRLEKFKASKAKSFETPDDLLNGLIKEGYFEKLKFMGYTYKMNNDRINFGALLKQSKGKEIQDYDKSYIEYKIQGGTPEYTKLVNDLKDIRTRLDAEAKAAGKERVWDEYYVERDKIAPPDTLKIFFSLDGGKIVPVSIGIGKDRLSFY